MSSISVGIPTRDGLIHASIIESLWPQIQGSHVSFIKGVSPVAKARNRLVEKFLATEDTHLLMLDADTVPPPDGVKKLVDADRDIISGMTPVIQENEIFSNVWIDGKQLALNDVAFKDPNGLIHAQGVGASFILIHRKVFEKLEAPYFYDLWSKEGQYISEDIEFCNRAKEAGFDILVHAGVRCRHFKSVLL